MLVLSAVGAAGCPPGLGPAPWLAAPAHTVPQFPQAAPQEAHLLFFLSLSLSLPSLHAQIATASVDDLAGAGSRLGWAVGVAAASGAEGRKGT